MPMNKVWVVLKQNKETFLMESTMVDCEKMGENTFKAAKKLINNVLMIQGDEHINQLRYSEPKHFLKEFSTVKVCGPRRSGHSSCIPRIIFKYRLNPLVLSFNLNCSERLAKNSINSTVLADKLPYGVNICKETKSSCLYRCDGIEWDYSIYFSSINCLSSGSCNGLSCDSIIVDTASMLKSDQIESVYDFMVAQMRFIPIDSHPMVIFLE